MKIFAFIMAFIILAFSCMPCMDDVNDTGNGKVKREISKSTNQQDHNDTDNCSPFCTCNCCSGFAFIAANIKVGYTIHTVEKFYTTHLPFSVIEISLPIWQPPQLIS